MTNFRKTLQASLFLSIILLLGACQDKCKQTTTYVKYTPITKNIDDVRNSLAVENTRELQDPGKIYTYGELLYIVDRGRGIHIVDNSDPSNPQFTQFIALDGCEDVAMRGNLLYANQGPDIVVLNTSANYELVARGANILNDGVEVEDIIVAYEKEEVTETIKQDCDDPLRNNGFGGQDDVSVATNTTTGGNNGANGQFGGSTSSTGISGSMARFSIIGDQLYVVSDNMLTTYDVSTGFAKKASFNAGGGLETIFGTQEYLFIGTTTGMLIYDRNQGNVPTYVSRLTHARGCDPVVVQGNYAFVTLRGNGGCGNATDGLYVVDISNINNPKLHSLHPMNGPQGLAVRDNLIMICDGPSGLRVFDKTDLDNIGNNELSSDLGVNAYDVIMQENTCILSAKNGVYQYDYSDPQDLRRISTLIAK